jgi:hypothetical protein
VQPLNSRCVFKVATGRLPFIVGESP